MRLWTLHPQYLDQIGLVALWRESLLAQAVLQGKTNGYRHHPQLIRFQNHEEPLKAIGSYLLEILYEAGRRGYHFNPAKVGYCGDLPGIPVTCGQLLYERNHLLGKLIIRDPVAYRFLSEIEEPVPHPLFRICEGGTEAWERI